MKLEVLSVTAKKNGDAELEIEIDKEYKAFLKKHLGMKRWSNEKFQQFIIEALEHQLAKK